MRTIHTTLTFVLALVAGCAARPTTTTTTTTSPSAASPAPANHTERAPAQVGKYATVNGLQMYYEVHGTGRPLVLLHGAFCTIEVCFGKELAGLAANHQVIAIEQQGHGHTADIDRPLSMAQMANDTAELLKQLGITNADFLGYSVGTGIALELAIHRPELVGKLVLVSPAFNRAGLHPGMGEMLDQITPEMMAGTPWYQAYVKVAPNPDHWARLVNKVKQLDREVTDTPAKVIKAIKAPMLIIIADSDIVRPEHAVELFRLVGGGVIGDLAGLPRSQLAVLPATTHATIMDRDAWLLSMVPAFLDAPARN